MASGNNFVENPEGSGFKKAVAPNFADQQMPQKPRDEGYVIKDKKGSTTFPEVGGSAQVGAGHGVPGKRG